MLKNGQKCNFQKKATFLNNINMLQKFLSKYGTIYIEGNKKERR